MRTHAEAENQRDKPEPAAMKRRESMMNVFTRCNMKNTVLAVGGERLSLDNESGYVTLGQLMALMGDLILARYIAAILSQKNSG